MGVCPPRPAPAGCSARSRHLLLVRILVRLGFVAAGERTCMRSPGRPKAEQLSRAVPVLSEPVPHPGDAPAAPRGFAS